MAGQINDYPIFIDVTTGQPVRDFFSNVPATLPDVKQGDMLRLLIQAVRPNPNIATDPSRPWEFVTLPTTLQAAIGDATQAPELGTFYLQFGSATSGLLTTTKRYKISTFVAGDNFTNVGAASNATGVIFTASGTTPTTWSNGSTLQEITTDLAYNVTAAAMSTALNLLASIIAAGAVTIAGDDGGPYRILFTTAAARDTIGGNGDALYPSSSVTVYTARNGTTVLPEIQVVALEAQPAAICTSFAAMASAGVTIETIQGGGSGIPEIQRITLDPQPYGGTFTLTFSGQTTAAIPYDATAEDVQEALEALSNIAADEAVVTGASPQWVVTFGGTLTGNQSAMTGDGTGLRVPVGMIGSLDLSTEGILNLLDGGTSETMTFEITETSLPSTLMHEDVTVINDLIPSNPGAPIGIPTYLTANETKQQYLPSPPCDALTGGAAGALDALVTASFLTTGTIRMACVSGELSFWQLQTNTGALTEDAANGKVLPDDAHPSTNNVIWIKVL